MKSSHHIRDILQDVFPFETESAYTGRIVTDLYSRYLKLELVRWMGCGLGGGAISSLTVNGNANSGLQRYLKVYYKVTKHMRWGLGADMN